MLVEIIYDYYSWPKWMLFQEYGIEIRALPPTDEFFRMRRYYNSGLSDIDETIYGSNTIEHNVYESNF